MSGSNYLSHNCSIENVIYYVELEMFYYNIKEPSFVLLHVC